MKPSNYSAATSASRIRFGVRSCSFGAVLVAASDAGICEIALGDDPEQLARELRARFPQAESDAGDWEFDDWAAKTVRLIENPAAVLDFPLDIRGTAFQRRVWRALSQIPAGEKTTYSQVAARIGAPNAARAVAKACAANVLAVAIPCHRVVRTDGALSGYRWGVNRKFELLRREAGA